jgi:mannose-6-phosphate isomerase-like protein (cupin superfamily)
MKVNRFEELKPYFPPEHELMRCLRVQGFDASPATSSWMGMSWMLPGGHTSMSASDAEKMYFVLQGSLTLRNGEQEVTLSQYDSCYIAPREERQLLNATNEPVAVLLVMASRPPLEAASGQP